MSLKIIDPWYQAIVTDKFDVVLNSACESPITYHTFTNDWLL